MSNTPLHILNVSLLHIQGGTPQVCFDYSRALLQQGHRVTTLTRPDDPFAQKHAALGADIITNAWLGTCGPYNLFARHHCRITVKRIKPDIIIAHDGRASAFMLTAAGNIPVVDVNHGRGVKPSLKTSASFVLNNTQASATTKAVVERGHVYLIPNMIELNDHTPASRSYASPPVIGALGRLVKEKAYDVLIHAAHLLHTQHIPFTLLIGGEGEERAHLESLIEKYNLHDHVKLIGWVHNSAEFYQKLDLFCVPSRYESFSLVLLEAMRVGVPVVVSDADGPADIITHNASGLIAPKENPEALAEALKTALHNPQKTSTLAAAAYRTLQTRYALETVAKHLDDAIQTIITTHQKRTY